MWRLLRTATAALIIVGAANSALASPIFFTNEALFDSALGGTTVDLESFESNFTDGVLSVDFGQLTVTGDQNLIRTNPSSFATDGTGTIGIVDFNFNGNFVTFSFDSPINAFSLDVLAANDFFAGGNLILSNNNGASQILYSGLLPTSQVSFIGLIDNMTPFSSVTVTTTLSGDGVQYDRLRFGALDSTPTPVPEPSTMLLIGAGLAVARLRRYRRVNRRHS
jgi:hypothetical protein